MSTKSYPAEGLGFNKFKIIHMLGILTAQRFTYKILRPTKKRPKFAKKSSKRFLPKLSKIISLSIVAAD